MKITEVKLGIISVPLRVPFKTALRTVNSVEDVIVEIHTDTGNVGYGEAPPTGAITGDTTGAIIGALKDHIIKTLIGRDVDDFENLMKRFVEEDPNGNGEKDEKGFTFEPVPPYHVWNGDADFSGAWGVTTDWDPVMVKDNGIVCAPAEEGYKAYIKRFASMYREGLIDKECLPMIIINILQKLTAETSART